jgi:hypothetical protein
MNYSAASRSDSEEKTTQLWSFVFFGLNTKY